MKITGAIFDADGTLFDSMFVWEGLTEKYLRSKGINTDVELLNKVNGMYLKQAVSFISEKYNLVNSDAYKEMTDFLGNFYKKADPKEGVYEFLEFLKSESVKMCIATSSDKNLIEQLLNKFGFDKYFEFIITSNDIGSSKHSPEIFNYALKMLGTERTSTFVFEDTAFAAQTAKKAGFKVCGVFDAHELNQDFIVNNSDIYLNSFVEAEKIFK